MTQEVWLAAVVVVVADLAMLPIPLEVLVVQFIGL